MNLIFKNLHPPAAVSKYVYERCIFYTILAKIAPKWNIVSNYFVKGRDFITDVDARDCINLCIRTIGKKQFCLMKFLILFFIFINF